VQELIDAGADIIAVDATARKRANGQRGYEFVASIKEKFSIPVLADVDELEAGIAAARSGADAIATTLAGYTYGQVPDDPDIALVASLASRLTAPVIGEGRFRTAGEVKAAFNAGAWSVCVGSAITDPWTTTKYFIDFIESDPSMNS